jgi:hypothetical protein
MNYIAEISGQNKNSEGRYMQSNNVIGVITPGNVAELRVLTYFSWRKHAPDQAIHSEPDQVYGRDVITLRTIQKWTAAFESGCTDLVDLARSGVPRDTGKVDAVRALVESEGCLSQKKIAHILGIHHETVKSILRDDLTMRKVNCKWLRHALKSSQKAARVEVSRELLNFLESRTDRSFSNVNTEDETWRYLDNPRTSLWIGADVTNSIRVRRTVAAKKHMCWIEFSRTGIGAVVMLPAQQISAKTSSVAQFCGMFSNTERKIVHN